MVLLLMLVLVTLVLTACGEAATSTPTTKAVAATAVPATTIVAAPTTTSAATKTVAATTAPATTTVAPTTVATTTAAATTIAATTTVAPTSPASSLQFELFSEGNFSVLMPGTPKLEQQQVNGSGKSTTLYQYTVDLTDTDATYVASYAIYPADVKLDPTAVLNGTRDGQVGTGKLISDKDIKLGTVPGKEIELTRNGVYFKARDFFTGTTLYQITAGYVEGKQDAQSIQTFLESFKITAAPAQVTPVATAATIADPAEITLDPALQAALTKAAPGVADLKIQMFVSDDEPKHLATKTEADVTKAGYKFALPGATTLVQSGTAYTGGYTLAGSSDLLFVIGTLSDDPTQLAKNLKDFDLPGMDQIDQTKFLAQVKGHKSLILLMTGTGLGAALSGGATTTPVATTAPAVTTAASSNPLTEIAVDPAIQAAFVIQVSSVTDLSVQMFVSDTAPEDLATTTESDLLKTGYKFALSDHTQIYKVSNGHSYAGAYAKTGEQDLVLGIGTLTDDQAQLASNLQELNIPGLAQADSTKFLAQIKGHKTLMLLVSGTGLLKALNP